MYQYSAINAVLRTAQYVLPQATLPGTYRYYQVLQVPVVAY
jgi:hypothetical protein